MRPYVSGEMAQARVVSVDPRVILSGDGRPGDSMRPDSRSRETKVGSFLSRGRRELSLAVLAEVGRPLPTPGCAYLLSEE